MLAAFKTLEEELKVWGGVGSIHSLFSVVVLSFQPYRVSRLIYFLAHIEIDFMI